MRVSTHSDPALFSALATPFLLRDEVAHCIALGLLGGLVNVPPGSSPCQFFALEGSADLEGVAWQSPGSPLGLSAMSSDAVDALVEHLAVASGGGVSAVTGPKPAVDQFKDRWLQRRGGSLRKTIDQLIHRLDRVTPSIRAAGAMRVAMLGDLELVSDWSVGFVADCGLDHEPEAIRRATASALSQSSRVLWDFEGRPVSMAKFQGKTPNGIRVSWVYTPSESRGRAYASALVAALSAHLLRQGNAFCCLYTDAGNPTSNRIYQAIGYRAVCDAAHHTFAG